MPRDIAFDMLRSLLVSAQSAFVFGSYAQGGHDEFSDLDIMVVKETNKNFFHRHEEFPELYDLGVPVDLLVYTPEEFQEMKKRNNPFVLHILETGKKLI